MLTTLYFAANFFFQHILTDSYFAANFSRTIEMFETTIGSMSFAHDLQINTVMERGVAD